MKLTNGSGASQTSGTTANNFTSDVVYFVTAADGTTTTYTATVTTAANTAKAITAFSFAGLSPTVTGTINESAKTIALTVPYGTVKTALVSTFTASAGASVKLTNGSWSLPSPLARVPQ
ncbi:MAG: hypothetical protein NTU82_03870 [Actinobacteria bacterium]|nr:hypothetical protein [Actinomycetota bacterium]